MKTSEFGFGVTSPKEHDLFQILPEVIPVGASPLAEMPVGSFDCEWGWAVGFFFVASRHLHTCHYVNFRIEPGQFFIFYFC